MADIEKVIKGLECCTARNGSCQYEQEPICPYVEHCRKEDYAALQRDVLVLLKEQEAEIAFLKAMQLQTVHNMSNEDIGNAVRNVLRL